MKSRIDLLSYSALTFALVNMAMLALVACTPESQSQLEKGCKVATTAYSAYTIAAEGELIPPEMTERAEGAWKSIRIICDNPPTDPHQAVITLTAATVVLIRAWKDINTAAELSQRG